MEVLISDALTDKVKAIKTALVGRISNPILKVLDVHNHPLAVTQIEKQVNLIIAGKKATQPEISHGLRLCRAAGLVVWKTEGKFRKYEINPAADDVVKEIINL